MVDGGLILDADVEKLEAIGVASNVAQQIVNAVQAQRQGLPSTQVGWQVGWARAGSGDVLQNARVCREQADTSLEGHAATRVGEPCC